MSAPDPSYTVLPSTADMPPADFGPDHTDATDVPPFENIPTKTAPKPRNGREPRAGKSVFGNLGQNKKLRSPVRKLTEKDRDAIASGYMYGAMGVMLFNEPAAKLMATSATKYADCWLDVADENDKVRRFILGLMEGGVWGKLFLAHMPLLALMVPKSALPPKLRDVDFASMVELFNAAEDTD